MTATKARRAHRATGNPVGRPSKKKKKTPDNVVDLTVRRYGPEQMTEEEVLELERPLIRQDFTTMNEQQLRSFALTQYGRRYQEGELVDAIRDDIRARQNMNLTQRYL